MNVKAYLPSAIKKSLVDFNVLILTFVFRALEDVSLGPDQTKGDKWRGALGYALKRETCRAQYPKNCPACELKADCTYFMYFLTDKPHPYILRPRLDTKPVYAKGEEITLELVLIGNAIVRSHAFITALINAGKKGMGKGRARLLSETLEITQRFDFNDIL
ncbi:MAG: hypothetical protein HQK96_14700, partial [Nitrospirae bacterium]|nr:hypothetical protein [Nitrospirota bacterium]